MHLIWRHKLRNGFPSVVPDLFGATRRYATRTYMIRGSVKVCDIVVILVGSVINCLRSYIFKISTEDSEVFVSRSRESILQ